jgi:sarcosine oxidase subunit alpha
VIYEGNDIKGHVCTCRFSISLNETIGLALVKSPLAKEGSILNIYQNDGRGPKLFQATVVSTPFYDPEGHRLRI